jgi:uncharacterized ferritin-like protein (DUF455 family)
MPDSRSDQHHSDQPSRSDQALDPALFADGPARDDRFVVRDRWIECDNFPADHSDHQVEFAHRQMNEEINGLECSARNLADFPDADWSLRMWFARQCSDEARHGRMFRRLLESRGGWVGQFPVLNFQYRIITKSETLAGRLTIQNRTFEAGGIDAVSSLVHRVRAGGEDELADFFESQLADEILHVAFANEWLKRAMRDNPRILLQMGAAMSVAAKGFAQVMGKEATEDVGYPTDRAARLEAGFSEREVDQAVMLAAGARR